jgi:pimeloyl-ACP methyl ester carboxylesterase
MGSTYDPRVEVQGDGPPVVLVPGMDGTGRLYYRQTPLLARSYRVATYTLRDDATRMETLVADLASVIDSVAPAGRPAIVVGESFGGALSLSLALARPERVEALVILNSFPYFAPQLRLRLAIHGLGILPWGAMPLVRRLTAFRMHSKHTHRDDVQRFLALTRQSTKAGYIGRLRILERYDVRHRLHDIRCPTLFLAAEQDHLVPSVPQARYMATRVSGSTVRVLIGHGHICLIAQSINLASVLTDWLR